MAIKVEVEFIGLLREITGEHQFTLDMEDGATLKDAIGKLADRYGRGFETRILEENGVSDDALVILNGRIWRMK